MPAKSAVRCIYCGEWVDIEDGTNLVRLHEDGYLLACHPRCLDEHRAARRYDGTSDG